MELAKQVNQHGIIDKRAMSIHKNIDLGSILHTACTVDGYSYSAMGRFYGLDRRTVKKYIQFYLLSNNLIDGNNK